MSMKKNYGEQLRTRLLRKDADRFRQLARDRNVSQSQLAREALLRFMYEISKTDHEEVESMYSAQIKSSTNRICSFLARVAADVRATYMFVGEQDPERIKKWRAAALRQIVEKLPLEDAELAKRLLPQQVNSTHRQT